jgi:hypothetical protein
MQKMNWRAGRAACWYSPDGYWRGRMDDGTVIEVHPKIYEKQLNAYLERVGVRRTNWMEILERANQEWAAFQSVLDAFAADLEQWLAYDDPDVYVKRPEKDGQIKTGQ